MNINHLQHFISVAREKNITKTADELYISQQALSKSINALEEELGVVLFLRSGKGTELTDIGEKIYPIAESLLKKYEEHITIIDSLIKNNNLYTVSLLFEHQLMQYVIPPDFISRIGDMKIKTSVAADYLQCTRDVLSEKYDLGFVHKPHKLSNLIYIPVVRERPVIIMSSENPLSRKDVVHIEDLKNEPQLSPATNATIFQEYLEACIDNGFYPNFVFESSDLEMLLRSAAANQGVFISASFGLSDNAYGNITFRPLECKSLTMEVGFIAKSDYKDKLHLASFIRAIKSYYD